MISAHIIFTDNSTGIKWDTDTSYYTDEKNEELPPEGSMQYERLIEHAVENIWGNNCSWKKDLRYNEGSVVKRLSQSEFEKITNILSVIIK